MRKELRAWLEHPVVITRHVYILLVFLLLFWSFMFREAVTELHHYGTCEKSCLRCSDCSQAIAPDQGWLTNASLGFPPLKEARE